MRDQGVIFQQNYIQFVFNGGVETVAFSNYEVLGDLEYVPEHTQEIQQGENGKSFSLMRKQQEYFAFTIDYDKTATRKKVEKLRNYIRQGYELSFVVPAYPTIFDDYEFYNNLPTSSDPEVKTISITFSKAVIELPEDFAFDSGARGEGMTIVRQIPVRVLKSATLPVPVSECSLVSISDFDLNPWNVDAGTNELISVIVDVDPTGLIDTIDSRPDGTVTYVSGGSGVGGTVENMTWNAVQSRYEPVSGPFILDGIYTVSIPGIAITLNSGQECTFTFTQTLEYTINTVPEAQSVTIAGTPRQGQELTLTWTYYDAQGDLQDATPIDVEVWYSFPTLTEAQNGDLTNATQLGTGSAYTIGSGIVGEYIAARVKPYAQTGSSPGDVVFSNVLGPVATNSVAYTLTNNLSGTFQVNQTLSSAETVGIDWGDGTFETFAASSGNSTYDHAYLSSTRTITVYTDATKVTDLVYNFRGVTAANLANLTTLKTMNGRSNSGMTSITNPTTNTGTWGAYRLDGNNITGTLDISSLGSMPTDFMIDNNTNLTALVLPTSTANIGRFSMPNTGITGALDLSGIRIGGSVYFQANSGLTGLTFGTPSTTNISLFYCYATGLTGTLDISSLTNLGGAVFIYNNSNLEGITFPSSSVSIVSLRLNNNGLTSLDLSPLTNVSGTISFNNNPSLASVTMPTTSNLITTINGSVTEITSVDLSPMTNISGLVNFSSTTTLTTVTMPSSNATAITSLLIYDCDLEYFDLTGNTFSDNVVIDLSGNSMTAAEVNHLLVDLDATLPSSGTGSIDISGSNSGPDTTSGGYNGSAAATSLAGKGYTVTTS